MRVSGTIQQTRLQQAHKLEQTGITEDQAKALVTVIGEQVHTAVSSAISDVATKEDLERMATKEDLERMATKEDLERLSKATQESLEGMATKEDLENLSKATQESLEGMATKEDLERMATKEDLKECLKEMATKEGQRLLMSVAIAGLGLSATALIGFFVLVLNKFFS